MGLYIPKAFVNASATVKEKQEKIQANAKIVEAQVDNSNKVVARIDMSEEVAGAGLCPECRKKMVEVMVNDVPMLACHEHRIVLPYKDELQTGKDTQEWQTGNDTVGDAFA